MQTSRLQSCDTWNTT